MTKFYVAVQANLTVFGAGNTPEEARTNAAEWLDSPESEEMPLVAYTGEWSEAAMQGRVVVAECSEALFNEVSNDPQAIHEWDAGWLITEEEAEANED